MTELGLRLRDELGERLLAYVLGIDVPTLESVLEEKIGLPDTSQEAWKVVEALLKREIQAGAVPHEGRTPGQSTVVSYLSMQKSGLPLAVRLHLESGGTRAQMPNDDDPALRALASLASDVFPVTLLEKRPDEALYGRTLSLGFAIRESPHEASFEDAVLVDDILRQLFQKYNEQSGHSGEFFTNLGQGSGLQLWLLSEGLISAAERELLLEDNLTEQALVDRSVSNLQKLRTLVRGETVKTAARIGIAGMELDGVEAFQTPWGVLRPVREAEHREVEELQATRADAVLEVELEMRLYLGAAFPEEGNWRESEHSKKFIRESGRTAAHLNRVISNLGLSVFLAIERIPPLVPIQVWSRYESVFETNTQLSWNPGLVGVGCERFDDNRLAAVSEWASRIETAETSTIEIAIRRTLAAQDLRRTPADGLVDAVIALENLFGTKDPAGEVTFRVSVACAFLLEDEPAARRALRKEVADLYTQRSKIVHGSTAGDEIGEERNRCVEIVRLSLQCLLRDRPELLPAEPRGTEIIMGG